MAEILGEAPVLVQMEPQFEPLEQLAREELLFPKLDGILFPIVLANAEVVAPCRWMGDAEVSLTVALNNYYQMMTEENADEVIADVYEFLAREPLELELVIPELDPTILIIERAEEAYDNNNEEADKISVDMPPAQSDRPNELVLSAVISRSYEHAPMEVRAPAMPAPDASVVNEKKVTRSDTAAQTIHYPEIKKGISSSEEVILLPPAQDDLFEFVELPAPMDPLPLESRTEYEASSASTVISAVEYQEKVDEGTEDSSVDSPVVKQEPSQAKDVHDTGVYVAESIVEESEFESIEYEAESLEVDNENVTYQNDDIQDFPEVFYFDDDTKNASPVEASYIEPPHDEITVAINGIQALLVGLGEAAEMNEVDERRILLGLVEVVAELSRDIELEQDENGLIDNDEYAHEQLFELYATLLENLPSAHKRELISLLIDFTLVQEASVEESPLATRSVISTRIKGLTVIVKKLKTTLNHVIAMGRLALKSHFVIYAKTSEYNTSLRYSLPPSASFSIYSESSTATARQAIAW